MGSLSVFSVINTASFSFGASLVCLTCLVYLALRGRFEKSQTKLVLAIVVILIVNSVSSMVAEVLKHHMLTNIIRRIWQSLRYCLNVIFIHNNTVGINSLGA